MFGKDKIKGHNRVTKGKSGFKVTRIGDFLRKKKDNTKRNLVVGAGVVALGTGLLLKRKGIGLTQIKNKLKAVTANTPKYPNGAKIRSKGSDMVVKKDFDQLSDPWETPIQYKVSKDLLRPKRRGNLTRKDMLVVSDRRKVTESVTNMSKTQKNYDSLSPEMKATVQMEKALVRPQRTSSKGRPPERTTLKRVLDKPIEKATRKVRDRLLREKVIKDSRE